MKIFQVLRQPLLQIGAVSVLLLVNVCCSEIKPYEPYDHRKEGPQTGLFTGPEGEVIIFRKTGEPQKAGEEKKDPDVIDSTIKSGGESDYSGNEKEP